MSKALLIKSQEVKAGGGAGKWNEFEDVFPYIQGIDTGKIAKDIEKKDVDALISGIPTPWARAKLFKFAFENIATRPEIISAPQKALEQIYALLHAEWRGLIAVMALYPDRISFSEPVTMDVRNNDMTAAFGQMLFEDIDLWCNQDELATNPDALPFMQLIYYKKHLVGGTSPMTGCFTGVDYSELDKDVDWYSNGRFEDPMKHHFTQEEAQKVYLFVKNMCNNLNNFETKINSQRKGKPKLELDGFKRISRLWIHELQKKFPEIKENGLFAQYEHMAAPFADLFKSSVNVFMKPDFTFTFTETGMPIDIQNLLSRDKYVVGWKVGKNEFSRLESSPVHYLKVPESGDFCNCFSLPLSEQGIDIFKNSLATLLSGENKTKLTAEINDTGDELMVTFMLKIDGDIFELNKKEYKIHWIKFDRKVILWPNFVSDDWNKYYLYSEFTSDAEEKFISFFKSNGEILKDAQGRFLTSDTQDDRVEVKKLVTYPPGQDFRLKYNIISTDKPIAGVMVKVNDAGKFCGAGVLMLSRNKIKDLTKHILGGEAKVGIDFGSNNTCVYYEGPTGVKPIEFKNYRAVIVGKENTDIKSTALPDELLFFGNYESYNGQLKSWLHEQHDPQFIKHFENAEIAGGVPVNRPNILVNKMDEFSISTNAGKLHYNMKWLNGDKGVLQKRAFLMSVWLQTCAFLYQNKIAPSQINWSYPGSMMSADVNELERIFEELCDITPLKSKPELNSHRTTEAEAVCRFALSKTVGLTSKNLFLGIDVGGSTSDILLLAQDPCHENRSTLFNESSVRLGAGAFFNAVIGSRDFREALLDFHEGKSTNVFVANIREIINEQAKSPYYLNSIFDQLKTKEECGKFYSSMADHVKSIFVLPAYVTGLLLYYSGMLIGKTIQDKKLDNIRTIEILSFGKGGRLFHWLRHVTSSTVATKYYGNCLNSGIKRILGRELENIHYREDESDDNKAEVAKGLCNEQDLHMSDTCQSDICICAEEGVCLNGKKLQPVNELKGTDFAKMNLFDFSDMQCFKEFYNLFMEFLTNETKISIKKENLNREIDELSDKVVSSIENDSEYKKAREIEKNTENGFAYHQPLLIAEGVCFLQRLNRKFEEFFL